MRNSRGRRWRERRQWRPGRIWRRRRLEASATSPKPELEEAVAAPGLAVVIALRCGAADDLDLPVVQSEPPIDGGDLRLDRPLIGQEDSRRAAFDKGGCDRARLDIGERLRGEDDRRILLAQRLQPFAELLRETRVVKGEPAFVDNEEGRPSGRAGLRSDGRGKRERPVPRPCR